MAKRVTKAQLEQNYDTLRYFLDCLTLFWGQMGTGKTTNTVAMAYWMRELFELPVISVGATVGLTQAFGAYHHMPLKEFVEQLILISKISDEIIAEQIPEDDIPTHLQWCKENRDLKLYRSILLVDEMYHHCNARTPSNRLNLVFLNFIAQMRHYHCTMIAMTPNPMNVDVRVRDQVRWSCKPDPNPETKVYTLRFKGPQGSLTMAVHGPDYAGKYPGDPARMFNSWAFTGFNAKGLEKVLAKDV